MSINELYLSARSCERSWKGVPTVTAVTDLVCYGLTFWEFRIVCEPVSDAREPVSAFCAGKRFPGGGDGQC